MMMVLPMRARGVVATVCFSSFLASNTFAFSNVVVVRVPNICKLQGQATSCRRWKREQFSASQSASDAEDDSPVSAAAVVAEEEDCPRGYFLDTVHERCSKLGPLGRVSQVVETFGPLKKVSKAISSLFGIDKEKIGKHGVAFALTYSIISNINGSISLSVAWYLSCARTGLSPLAPGQWKELLKSYGTIYAFIQLMRPFRVAAAIAMSKLSNEFLIQTQEKLDCSRGIAILFQYLLGWMAWLSCSGFGITVASWLSGVPIFSNI